MRNEDCEHVRKTIINNGKSYCKCACPYGNQHKGGSVRKKEDDYYRCLSKGKKEIDMFELSGSKDSLENSI